MIYEENSQFFKEYDPLLLEELRQGQVTTFLTDEALARALIGTEQKALHLHFGFGTGAMLLAEKPRDHGIILIFEPSPEMAYQTLTQVAVSDLFQSRKAALFCRFERFAQVLKKCWRSASSVRLIISPEHKKAFPKECQQIKDLVCQFVEFDRFQTSTEGKMKALIHRSSIASLDKWAQLPKLSNLSGQLQGQPAVILGAGPSLDKNIGELKTHRDKFQLFSISRTAAICEQHGIAPDFMVHIEAQDFVGLFSQCQNLTETTFVLAEQTQRRAFELATHQTLVVKTADNPVSHWWETVTGASSVGMLSSGSVSSIAVYAAILAGCNPIILVGHDLALTNQRTYGQHYDSFAYAPERLRHIEGYFGETVESLDQFMVTSYWFSQVMPDLLKQCPELQCINATEGGAKIPYFRPEKLRHVLQQINTRRKPMPKQNTQLQDIQPKLKQLHKSLTQLSKLCLDYRRISRALRKKQKPNQLMRHIQELEKINQLFVGVVKRPGLVGFFHEEMRMFQKMQKEQKTGKQEMTVLLKERLLGHDRFYESLATTTKYWQELFTENES